MALSLLRHPSWDVRAAAARVLGTSAGPDCLPAARQALEAAGLIVAALDEAHLTPAGHRLVNLRWLSSRLAREPRTGLGHVTVRFRAVTETP